jgi:hypothetical protein
MEGPVRCQCWLLWLSQGNERTVIFLVSKTSHFVEYGLAGAQLEVSANTTRVFRG